MGIIRKLSKMDNLKLILFSLADTTPRTDESMIPFEFPAKTKALEEDKLPSKVTTESAQKTP